MPQQAKSMSDKERIDWLRLIRSENVGPKTFQALLGLYGTVQKALEAIPQLSLRGGRGTPIKVASVAQAQKEIEASHKVGARIIVACEPEYPVLLRQVKDFPPVITVFGDVTGLNRHSVAIVGARNASANGCRFAHMLARELGQKGLVTVSGLARGVDTHVHQGSLATGTIAVVAGGINRIYPPENADLFRQVGENGAVISEMAYDAEPKAQNFPRRNRIISGMSLGTIVVEAARRSGSLITARMALEQDREVFAVPGSPLDPRAEGTNDLIRQGAHLVSSSRDVLDVIEQLISVRQKGLFDKETPAFKAPQVRAVTQDELDGVRPLVCSKIGTSPTLVDDIVTQTGLAPNVILTILLELELAGRLDRHAGNKVSLVYAGRELFDDAV